MTTRRLVLPDTGERTAAALVHAIERHNLDALPGDRVIYAGRQQLESGLSQLLSGLKTVAMEYSPMCAIPYLSRVDAGTVEMVRARGVEVVSSGDLVQQFEAAWTTAQLETHRAASSRCIASRIAHSPRRLTPSSTDARFPSTSCSSR
jgi:hypothetical protein